MLQTLVQYISQQLARPLTADEEHRLSVVFRPKRIRKHQYLLQEGDICRVAGFIVRGALRQYTIDATGRENTLALYLENWWAADRESYFNGTPSPYYIVAQEDTDMMVATREDMLQYKSEMPFMAEMARVLTERQALHLLKRVHAAHTMTAEQRLAELEQRYPEFLQRFPQHVIASYLGMTKETLSRIRGNATRR